MIRDMPLPADLDQLNADQLRCLLIESQARIDKLTYELAYYKRQRYGVKAEPLSPEQAQLFEETADADLAAMSAELEQLSPSPAKQKGQAKRQPLPAELPRTEIHHEPESTTCACGCQMKRIGEDVAEKLDYTPGTFTVERHIRGKWACAKCETLVQAPVPAHVIDKGIPTTGLLAQVLIAKYLDHLPLYRQEAIFGRAGLPIPQSTLAQWVGICGVQLQPLVVASLRLGAWRIQGASSLICMSAARARSQGRLVRISVNSMTWNVRSSTSALRSACKFAKPDQNHWLTRFTRGCC